MRLALVTSRDVPTPPVSFQISQLSIVPNSTSPASAPARAPGTWSSSQRSRGPGEVGGRRQAGEPLDHLAVPVGDQLLRRSPSVRVSCQVIALRQRAARCAGSRRRVVSRWLAMPSATMFSGPSPARAQRRRHDLRHVAPDLLGVVLDPARRRVVLAVLALRHRHHPPGPVEQQAPRRRRALVDGRDHPLATHAVTPPDRVGIMRRPPARPTMLAGGGDELVGRPRGAARRPAPNSSSTGSEHGQRADDEPARRPQRRGRAAVRRARTRPGRSPSRGAGRRRGARRGRPAVRQVRPVQRCRSRSRARGTPTRREREQALAQRAWRAAAAPRRCAAAAASRRAGTRGGRRGRRARAGTPSWTASPVAPASESAQFMARGAQVVRVEPAAAELGAAPAPSRYRRRRGPGRRTRRRAACAGCRGRWAAAGRARRRAPRGRAGGRCCRAAGAARRPARWTGWARASVELASCDAVRQCRTHAVDRCSDPFLASAPSRYGSGTVKEDFDDEELVSRGAGRRVPRHHDPHPVRHRRGRPGRHPADGSLGRPRLDRLGLGHRRDARRLRRGPASPARTSTRR